MQSIFRLPWCTDHFGAEKYDAVPPAMDLAALKKLKRKRAVTPDPPTSTQSDAKRQRPATAVASDYFSAFPAARLPVSTPSVAKVDTSNEADKENMADVEMTAEVKAAPTLSKLQQAIENQLNLQILMKHNELRLIDQELAKCQVALEQLRRCEIKPYPGSEGFDYSVSSGTGSATLPPPGYTKASHAAPHGVTDGPYTRHYRRWLLPDAQFDPQPFHMSPVDDALASRSTRHAGVRKSVATPSREYPSLPAYAAPAPRKDSSTPLILRRSTDNKLVKLVCNNCNRGNMSSIQGFLNHCRIAHKVVYESHDAAAIDCGRILDDTEIASLPTEAQAIPVSKPVLKHTPSRTASVVTPIITSQSVHPLNKPGVAVPKSAISSAKPIAPVSASQPAQFATTPFKPAAGLPKLSALFARRSCGGDLDHAVAEARRKSDFIDDAPSPLTPGSPAVVTPTGGRGMLGVNRPGGKTLQARPSYFVPTANEQSPGDNLSPHTIDSNPGLVSDVEDDDNGSASEEESHADAPMPFVRRDCADNMDIDVEDSIQHGVVIRRNSILGAEDQPGGPSRKFGNN